MTLVPTSAENARNLPAAQYRPLYSVPTAGAIAATVTGAGTYVSSQGGPFAPAATAGNFAPFFYLDPAQYLVTGLSTFLRLIAGCAVNDTAPACTFTLGLYPVGAPSGAATILNPNVGAVVAGSTVAIVTPAANAVVAAASSGDFAIPAAGFYTVAMVASGAMAANSKVALPFSLQARNA